MHPPDNTDDTPRHDASPLDDTRHTLTVEEASALFADAGFSKSPRTIQRYCKGGILECLRTDTELGDKYLIARASVERRIEELHKLEQILATTDVASRPVMSRHAATGRDTSRHDETRRDTTDETEFKKKIEQLENDNLNLRIDNKGKEQTISFLAKERSGWLDQLTKQAERIGELNTELLQLMPGGQVKSPRPPEPPQPFTVVNPSEAVDNSSTDVSHYGI